jgi:hypothetical protein
VVATFRSERRGSEEAHRVETRCCVRKLFIEFQAYTGMHKGIPDEFKAFLFMAVVSREQGIPGRSMEIRECKIKAWIIYCNNKSILYKTVLVALINHQRVVY